MKLRPGKRSRKASAPIVAAIVLFGIILSVGSTYFYTTMTQERYYQQQVYQHLQQQNLVQQGASQLVVYGTVNSQSLLDFFVNNTGTAVTITAWWVMNGTDAQVIQYENATYKNPYSYPTLPYYLGQGQSVTFNTTIAASNILQIYMIKVLTSSGITAVGSYPNNYFSASSLNSDIAAGLGSTKMTFSSFTYYNYVTGPPNKDPDNDYVYYCSGGVQCNGGSNVLDMNGHSGSLVPAGQNHTSNGCGYCGEGVPIAFSINITNVDPQGSTIVFNSNANLWVMETCDAGTPTSTCGQTSPVYVFYVMDVNTTTGSISSSFSQITIPYGVTKTLFFGAAYPLSQQQFQVMSLMTDDSVIPGNNLAVYGQFAVFLLLPGTKIAPTELQLYGQNIPFESTIAGDNLGWYGESPDICAGNTACTFQFQVNNSVFSGASIDQVTLDGSAFTSVSATAPNGWKVTVTNGLITWSATGSALSPNTFINFTWSGLAPSLPYSVQEIFPISMYWNGGSFSVLQAAAACYVNANLLYASPKSIPTGVLYYVPISMTNLQTSPVAGGTPVMLNVNWSSYATYLDNPVDNVVFFDYSGNSLNAWMENGTANTVSNSMVWVKLNSTGLAAVTTDTIYMGIYAKGTSHLSATGPFGEAPQLSSTYAQYDDGADVFSIYVNGNTPVSQFNTGNGITLTQATGVTYGSGSVNALHVTGTGTDVTVVYKGASMSNVPMTAESNFESQAVSTSQGAVSLSDNTIPGSSTNAIAVELGYSSSYFSNAYESGGSYTFGQNRQGSGNTNWNFGSVSYLGSTSTSWNGYISSELYVPSNGYSGTVSNNPLSGSSAVYLSILSYASGSKPDNMYYNWMRDRVSPPNGQMPYSTLGPLIVV